MEMHNEEFEIENEKINKDSVFCIIGDIHNTKYSKIETWNKLIEEVRKTKPNFIVIPGDIIYTADDLIDGKNKLTYLLTELSKIAPLYITYGNHDLKNGIVLKYSDTNNYFKGLEDTNKNIHIINNKLDRIEDSNIFLLGINPSYDSYYSEYKNKWASNFINQLLNIDIKNIKGNGILILVIHSPEILIEVKKYIEERLNSISNNMREELIQAKRILELVNVFICAHMHNGLIARKFEFGRKKNCSKGIVVSEGQKAVNGEMEHKIKFRVVDYCRGMHDLYNGKIIITRGITKWCQPNPIFGAIDQTCSKDITTVKILKK